MKAYNAGNKKGKDIKRFLKGVGSLSLSSDFVEAGIAKKKNAGMSLKKDGLCCRPLVWKLADVIGNIGIILSADMRRSPIGITNARVYLKEVQSMEVSRKVASQWLNDGIEGNGNRYRVYRWVEKNKFKKEA